MTRQTDDTLKLLYSGLRKGRRDIPGLREFTNDLTKTAQLSLSNWKRGHRATNSNDCCFQVIDFFSGCGGMSLGFGALSDQFPFFRTLGGCDINEEAARTYCHNFSAPSTITDVRTLVGDESALDAFLSKLDRYDPGQPLVVIGCAPCQGFSSHRKKNWSQTDTRNSLVGAFASVAVRLNPECIVMENVPEMLGKRYWSHFTEAKDIFERAGYVVRQSIYNAAAFGVPQERFRAVVIAMKRDFLLPAPLLPFGEFATVRDAIGGLPPVAPGQEHPTDRMHRSAEHRKATIDTIQAVPKDGGSRPVGVGPECLDRVNGFTDVYGRLHWDNPAITITHYARNPASGRFTHPEQDRGLTMREAALLQSFPDGFEFTGSFDGIFKQIGESVPPRMACAIASSILVELASPAPTEIERHESVTSVSSPVSSSYSSVIAGMKMSRRVK